MENEAGDLLRTVCVCTSLILMRGFQYFGRFALICIHCEQLGFTALMQSSSKGHTTIVEFLLEAGANKNVESNVSP